MIAFFVLAYALTWAGWALPVAAALGCDVDASRYWHLFGSLGPAVAAFVMAGLEGRAAVVRLARRCTRVPLRWLAVAILGPVVLHFIAAGVLLVLGHDVDIAKTGRSVEYPELAVPVYALANIVFYGFGEEIGWRGYALPRLQRTLSATRASLVVAVGWMLWHLPLFVFAGMSRMGPAEIVGWAASLVAGSFLMTSLFNASGSVLVVAVFHGVLDVVINSPTGGPLQSAMGALVTILGLTLPFRFGRERIME